MLEERKDGRVYFLPLGIMVVKRDEGTSEWDPELAGAEHRTCCPVSLEELSPWVRLLGPGREPPTPGCALK